MPCASCADQTCFTGQGKMPDNCPERNREASGSQEPVAGFVEFAARTRKKQINRINEVIEYARFMQAEKIGIASCIGLHDELRVVTAMLKKAGLHSVSVMCKTGTYEKKSVGVPARFRMTTQTGYAVGCTACNPVAQAMVLNREKTDLNLIIGLCVGHDSIFMKYSEAPTATLIAKDRSNGHNPAAILYNFYGDNFFDRRPNPEGAAKYNYRRIRPIDLYRMIRKKMRS